jgi:hypothetical protein
MEFISGSLDLNIYRRFGVEIEINAFDGRNRPSDGGLPDGSHYVAALVNRHSGKPVRIHKWAYDHNNTAWIVKPDSSCGIEVCSPVLKGWLGVMEVCRVIDGFDGDGRVVSDDRCSFHVHVDVSDLTEREVATVITWWVKCEAVFIDSVPMSRKRNQYCQLLAQSDIFSAEGDFMSGESLIRRLGSCKYFTINTYHLYNDKRKTIEFRIMDSECCVDAHAAKNWVRLLLHFVERAITAGMPDHYRQGDPWTGYCWLDPKDVFSMLGFSGRHELSPGLTSVKGWFLNRLFANCWDTIDSGVIGLRARSPAHSQIEEMHAGKPCGQFCEDVFDELHRV